MQTTGILGLKKPEGTDIVDIADLNGNMDILDNAVNGKVDKVTGKQLSTNDYTAVEKTKLAGIATGANNYVHPNHTGDVTSTGDGVTAIAAGVIVDADVNSAAGIGWTKLSKTGASLADLPTRSAADLSSGTLAAARLPAISGDITMEAGTGTAAITAGAIVNADVNAAAAIDASKIGTGVVSNAEFGYLDGVTSAIQTQLDTKSAMADYVRQPGYGPDTGTANVKVITLSPVPTAYVDGMGVAFTNAVLNTGACTINVNGLGVKPFVKNGGALASGNLRAGGIYMARYNATTGNFILQGEGGEYGTATAAQVLAGYTVGQDTGLVTGSMANNGAVTITPSAIAQAIIAGYHSGLGVVAAVTFDASKLLTGNTVAGTAGTMVNNGAGGTIIPSASTQTKAAGYYSSAITISGVTVPAANVLTGTTIAGTAGTMPNITAGDDVALSVGKWPSGDLAVYPRAGYRKGGAGAGELKVTVDQIRSVNAYLQPWYIKAGAEICGVTGTVIEGKPFATGTYSSSSAWTTLTVNTLAFQPNRIIIRSNREYSYSKQAVYSTVANTTFNNSILAQAANAVTPTWMIYSNGFTINFNEGQQVDTIYTWEVWSV